MPRTSNRFGGTHSFRIKGGFHEQYNEANSFRAVDVSFKLMNIFLQGSSGVGKSYLLRKALNPYVEAICGFVAQQIRENGVKIGFRTVTLGRGFLSPEGFSSPEGLPSLEGFPSPEAEYVPGLAGVFILRGRYDISVLDHAILHVERESHNPRCKLVLLDEIGGIELNSQIFTDALKRMLSSEIPITGVFKSYENLSHTVTKLDLNQDYFAMHAELETLIRNRGELITLTEENRAESYRYLTERLYPILCDKGESS